MASKTQTQKLIQFAIKTRLLETLDKEPRPWSNQDDRLYSEGYVDGYNSAIETLRDIYEEIGLTV